MPRPGTILFEYAAYSEDVESNKAIFPRRVGKVVAESDALEPTYRLSGKELYVRAKVISTKPHPNPYQKGDVEIAWTQPILP